MVVLIPLWKVRCDLNLLAKVTLVSFPNGVIKFPDFLQASQQRTKINVIFLTLHKRKKVVSKYLIAYYIFYIGWLPKIYSDNSVVHK